MQQMKINIVAMREQENKIDKGKYAEKTMYNIQKEISQVTAVQGNKIYRHSRTIFELQGYRVEGINTT